MNVAVLFVLIGTAGYLTWEANSHDGYATQELAEPDDRAARLLHLDRQKGSEDYLLAKHMADLEGERAHELVQYHGIPRAGASMTLMRNDPEIQGPRLFMRYCVSCHSYTDELIGLAIPGPRPPRDADGLLVENPDAWGGPDLGDFATPDWILGILQPESILSDKYFGRTVHAATDEDGAFKSGGMVEFVHDSLSELSEDEQSSLKDLAAAIAAQSNRPDVSIAADQIERGLTAASDFGCLDCHKLGDEGDLGVAPDLTGYGSSDWLREFIADPTAERFYFAEVGEASGNDRMPAFARHAEFDKNLLGSHELNMLVRWLHGDDRTLAR